MLEVKTKSEDSVTIIEIDGEVDLYSSPALRKALLEIRLKWPKNEFIPRPILPKSLITISIYSKIFLCIFN